MLTVGSLFSGIGGLELGLERTGGFKTVWQVEIDSYARRVLAKHWPNVRRWDDVTTFPPEPAEEWRCDLICGGFPCQDISNAGARAGIDGARSGLWSEFVRLIRILRPRLVLVENVAALLGRGAGRVFGDLAECGYDAEWDCLPAASFGAFHIRNRLFLLAYPNEQQQAQWRYRKMGRLEREKSPPQTYAELTGLGCPGIGGGAGDVHNALRGRRWSPEETVFAGRGGIELSNWWASEPGVGRVADGLSAELDAVRRDRCRVLGNAVVPQVAEWIGRKILANYAGKRLS